MTKTKKVKRLRRVVIDRAKWLTGEMVRAGIKAKRKGKASRFPDASGLRERGFQCCLGFVCQASGIGQRRLTHQTTPLDLRAQYPQLDYRLEKAGLIDGWTHPGAVTAAMKVNDSTRMDRKAREARVTALLAEVGWKVRFVGRYPADLGRKA